MNIHKPGPGWAKTSDGTYAPHYFAFADFPGARAVAGVFKALAVVVLVSGAFSALGAANTLHHNAASAGDQVAVIAGIVGGTIIAASAMAFFGYVLQLLVAIHFGVRYSDASEAAS